MANLKNTRSVALLRLFERPMGNVGVMSAKFSNQAVARSHSLAMAVHDWGGTLTKISLSMPKDYR